MNGLDELTNQQLNKRGFIPEVTHVFKLSKLLLASQIFGTHIATRLRKVA